MPHVLRPVWNSQLIRSSSEPVKTMAGQGKTSAKGPTMYVGLGTILLIVVLFLLFRALSGRRV